MLEPQEAESSPHPLGNPNIWAKITGFKQAMYGRYQTHQDKLNKLERQALAKALDEPYDEGMHIESGIKTGGIAVIVGGMLLSAALGIVAMKMFDGNSAKSNVEVGTGEVKIKFWQGDEEIPVTPKK